MSQKQQNGSEDRSNVSRETTWRIDEKTGLPVDKKSGLVVVTFLVANNNGRISMMAWAGHADSLSEAWYYCSTDQKWSKRVYPVVAMPGLIYPLSEEIDTEWRPKDGD